jgi:phosphoribosylanthranilate isomerase
MQLHWETPVQLRPKLRARFGKSVRIIDVVHFQKVTKGGAPALAFNTDADALLVDSRTAAAVGGTGQTYDWEMARRTIFQTSGQTKLIAAGGLTPENVAEAIATLHPWGVDVVSGVEAAPGRKDAAKVRAFIANARATRQDAAD